MSNSTKSQRPPIAVIGIGALFPGSKEPRGFWRDILAGRDLLTDVPNHYWLTEDFYDADPFAPDKTYAKRGAFLSKVDFDPMYFGIPPKNVPCTDTSQLLALYVARQVLEDAARGPFEDQDRERMSCILGVAGGLELLGEMSSRLQRPVIVKTMREMGMPEDQIQEIWERSVGHTTGWTEATFPGLLGNVVAGRIANRFDLGGMNCTTDAACASSFSAMSVAIDELYVGNSDVVITGGVDTCQDPFLFMCFSKTPALSLTGDCRPFSKDADGTMLGEGLGMVALKRLEDAERDGDQVYAVIRGVGASSDGRATSVYAPLPAGQGRAIRRAYENAGVDPATIELIEAHGTATPAGDVAEVSGLRAVFDETRADERQWCALGSVKSQYAHTKSASAAASLIKTVFAVRHKVLPPTIKVSAPNPKLGLDESAFYLNTETRPWIRDDSHPRRAGVSSFGFGGTNFHCVVEEYLGDGDRAARRRTCATELVLLGANDGAGLVAQIDELTNDLGPDTELLHFLARSSQEAFAPETPARLAIVASDDADLRAKLEQAKKSIAADGSEAFALPTGVYYATGAATGSIAFLFSGQGSQYVGMGRDVAMSFDAASDVWDHSANLKLAPDDDVPTRVDEVVYPRPVFTDADRADQQAQLTRTEWAQPALGTTSAALLAVLRRAKVEPSCVGGHSFGEVTALYAAGVLGLDDLLHVARKRGELMAEAAKIPGAMLAVGKPRAQVEKVLAGTDTDVVVANHNSPKQVVLSGPTTSIEKVQAQLREAGIRATRLPVATAFHSPVVAPSAAPFAEYLDGIELAPARLPVFANSTAAVYPEDPAEMRRVLAQQIAMPVRFAEQIDAMYAAGARVFIEVGAGAVLKNLASACLAPKADAVAITLDNKGKDGLTSLWQGLGQLAARGHAVDFAALWSEYQTFVDPRTIKKPIMTLPLDGMNYGRSYPPPGGFAELPKPNPPRTTTSAAADAPPTPVPGPGQAPKPAAQLTKPPLLAPSVTRAPQATPHVLTAPPVSAAPPAIAAAPFVAPSASPVMTTQPIAATTPSWFAACESLQQQTAAAHTAYQRLMADSHIAFLRAAEASAASLTALVTGELPIPAIPAPQPILAPAAPHPVPAQIVNQPLAPMAPAPTAMPMVTPAEAPAPRSDDVLIPDAIIDAPTQVNPFAGVDIEQMLFDVVAEKTGYPTEILNLDMALESDLGIDSIKRVEILSAIQDQFPSLPEVDASEVAVLQTLRQVLEFMEKYRDEYDAELAGTATVTDGPAAVGDDPMAQAMAAHRAKQDVSPEAMQKFMEADLEQFLLEVVAEKTGYPQKILNLEMSLESDLGIDSIKRVEILSAIQDKAPEMPEVDAAEMAALQTLGQVLEYMERVREAVKNGDLDRLKPALPAAAAEPATAAPVSAVSAPALALTAPPVSGTATGDVSLLRLAVEEAAAEAAGFALAGFAPGNRVAVTDDGRGIAEALIARLNTRGFVAWKATEPGVVPKDSGDTDALIFLGGLRPIEPGDVTTAIAQDRAAFAYAQAVAKQFTARGGAWVTVQDTGGDFGLSGTSPERAPLGGLAALTKTARVEWRAAALKAIDLEVGDRTTAELADAILQELLYGGPEIEVGLRADGRRTQPATRVRPFSDATDNGTRVPPPLSRESVLVATGGARGVTAATIIELCRSCQPRIALLGRTILEDEPPACANATTDVEINRALLADAAERGESLTPAVLAPITRRILANREIRATLNAIEAAGSEVEYIVAPVADAGAVGAALQHIRETWGPITGIIHGAGVLHDKTIADKTIEQFDHVFDTKVEGLRCLLAATAADPITTICIFSSVAARYGNLGQCDYAMANEVLNKMAGVEARRRGEGCVVRAINWGPWQGGMVTPTLEKHLHKMGVPLIPLQLGGEALVRELGRGGADNTTEILIEATARAGERFIDPSAVDVRVGLWVDETSHPYLRGHAIKDVPVVPVVMVLEWFTRAASACNPAMTVIACHDLRVLKGIRLESFAERPAVFALTCKRVQNGHNPTVEIELRGHNEGNAETLHYRARVELAVRNGHFAPKPYTSAELNLEPWPWSSAEAYQDELFHQPDFQVIRSLEGVSREAGVGTLAGVTEMGWPGSDWKTDPAVLDGGLQLARLWGSFVTGKASLPTRVAEYVTYTDGLLETPIRCVLTGREITNNRTKLDLAFATGDGHLAAEMLGVEMHTLSS